MNLGRMHRVLSFLSPPSACEYLPDQRWQLRYVVDPGLRAAEYMERLRGGWRRFGDAMFRPACPACRRCRSLRVPVATFTPSATQRRVWRKNREQLALRIGQPASSAEKRALLAKFHRFGHEEKGWPEDRNHDLRPFIENPFPTEEWCYYLGERLIAVGYVDALSGGLSAIYFYYDPGERHRSLGVFNVLSLMEAARTRGLPHVYLGYYVEGCRSLDYKARFKPNEVLGASDVWEPFVMSAR
jgi:leucyl-tRNA---protein transferase